MALACCAPGHVLNTAVAATGVNAHRIARKRRLLRTGRWPRIRKVERPNGSGLVGGGPDESVEA
eukprot:4564186-Prymnesium_polylepis.1